MVGGVLVIGLANLVVEIFLDIGEEVTIGPFEIFMGETTGVGPIVVPGVAGDDLVNSDGVVVIEEIWTLGVKVREIFNIYRGNKVKNIGHVILDEVIFHLFDESGQGVSVTQLFIVVAGQRDVLELLLAFGDCGLDEFVALIAGQLLPLIFGIERFADS